MIFFAMVAFFPYSQINDIFFWIPNVFLVAQAQILALVFLCCFIFCIKCFVGKFSYFKLNAQGFFLSIFKCFGIARNFSTIFSTHSSNECVLCLSCDLFCDGPASFRVNYLLQLSSSEVSITSGLFSSKIKSCCNLLKCFFHSAIAIYFFCAFMPVGRLIVWINARNCYSLGCHCVLSCR